ncbi:nascent polypeptide-associated complex subunit alpha, muscle-specific form-like isoform X4 [Panthera tigris]|uniref:nascent polypeptide-associated complex subunit alpha, muscle-specific form-like isoform X4 n=1 Tax=Panthera tigris TaxID=9694 RepID=UPI001C6FB035|nr:nascent polypeptide-associated complex subunit alpha, muscle-specific form-like isoform X4 [Panthera tigris]
MASVYQTQEPGQGGGTRQRHALHTHGVVTRLWAPGPAGGILGKGPLAAFSGTTEEAKTAGRRGKAEGSVGGGGTYCGADFPGGEKIRGASVRAEPEVTPANLRPSRAPGAQPHPTPAGKPSPLGTAAPPGAEPCLPGCPAPDSTPAHSSDAVAPPLNSFTGSNCPQTFFVTSNKNVSSPPIAEAPGDGDTRIKSTVYPRACGSPQTRGLVTPYTRGCALLQDRCCAPPQTPPHSPPGKGCIPSH